MAGCDLVVTLSYGEGSCSGSRTVQVNARLNEPIKVDLRTKINYYAGMGAFTSNAISCVTNGATATPIYPYKIYSPDGFYTFKITNVKDSLFNNGIAYIFVKVMFYYDSNYRTITINNPSSDVKLNKSGVQTIKPGEAFTLICQNKSDCGLIGYTCDFYNLLVKTHSKQLGDPLTLIDIHRDVVITPSMSGSSEYVVLSVPSGETFQYYQLVDPMSHGGAVTTNYDDITMTLTGFTGTLQLCASDEYGTMQRIIQSYTITTPITNAELSYDRWGMGVKLRTQWGLIGTYNKLTLRITTTTGIASNVRSLAQYNIKPITIDSLIIVQGDSVAANMINCANYGGSITVDGVKIGNVSHYKAAWGCNLDLRLAAKNAMSDTNIYEISSNVSSYTPQRWDPSLIDTQKTVTFNDMDKRVNKQPFIITVKKVG